jgi:hypothetical protein
MAFDDGMWLRPRGAESLSLCSPPWMRYNLSVSKSVF